MTRPRFLAGKLLPGRSAETKDAPRSLQRQYAAALGLVACLTIVNQLLLRQSLELKQCENAVIDVVGNERLNAQRLISAARAARVAVEDGNAAERSRHLNEATDGWSRSHESLQSLLGQAGVPADVMAAIRRGEPDYQATVDAAHALLRGLQSPRRDQPDRAELQRLVTRTVERAERFSRGLAGVANRWSMQVAARERLLARTGLLLVSITLLVLVAQGLLAFRRANRLTRSLLLKERMLAHDVREAKAVASHMATTLREKEAQCQSLALVATETDNVVIIADRERRIQWVNESFTRVTGYAFEEALGRKPESLLICGDEDPAAAEWAGRIVEGKGFKGEVAIGAKSGQKRWLMMDYRPAYDRTGAVRDFIIIGTDVTELKRTSHELERLAHRNDLILKAAAEGIYGVDREGRITFVNPAAAEMFGWGAEELVGKSHHDTLRHSNADQTPNSRETCPFCTALAEGRPYRAKNDVFWRKDGSSFPVEYTGTPVQEEGESLGAVVTFRDVSEQNALHRQLMQAQKLESIGQLAAGIAHEINTPIQFVGDNTRFLEDTFAGVFRALSASQALLAAVQENSVTEALVGETAAAVEAADLDYLTQELPISIKQSLEGIDRVAQIVRAMKEFSHPAVGTKVATDLSRAIQNTITIARNEWKYVADVVTDFDESLPPVPCFPGELNQTILNILVNAAHAIGDAVGDGTEGKGTITVSTRRDGDWAEIRIRDTGPGIPEESRSKIFNPFFTTKEVGKGTGQGLAVAHSVVVGQHQGTIAFETETGRGTTFIIRLPMEPEPPADEEQDLEDAYSVC